MKNCLEKYKKMEEENSHHHLHSGRYTRSSRDKNIATGYRCSIRCNAYSPSANFAENGTKWTPSSPANGVKTTTITTVYPPKMTKNLLFALPVEKNHLKLHSVPFADRNYQTKLQNVKIVLRPATLTVSLKLKISVRDVLILEKK